MPVMPWTVHYELHVQVLGSSRWLFHNTLGQRWLMAGDDLLWSQISLFGYGCFLGLVGVSDHVLGWHAAEYEAAGMIFSAVKCPSRCPMKSSLSVHEINRCIGAELASTGLYHLCWLTYISDSKNKVTDKSSWNDVPSGLALICIERSQLMWSGH